ncbi:MAG: DNA polymerase I [Planctomycetota bacterium]|nr:DNA polymerase I [Planctomycetota bacterium]
MPRKTLYLIDGHAQIYRAYYAPFGMLTSPAGEPTRATHVFMQVLLGILRDRKPDFLVMVMDVSDKDVFRTQLDPTYKANREAAPEDLGPQIDRIVSILELIKVPILRRPGFEADDLMATLSRRYASDNLDVVLVSKDKDLEQLLGEHVRMYDPGKDREIDAASMLAEKGYSPELAVEAQMLIGDSTDNIKGVTGVGPKKAAQLLQKYGSVQAIIDHADELTPKLRENVLAFRERMEVVRKLVTLRQDVEFEFDLSTADVARIEPAAARPVFVELGFRRLLEQIGDSPEQETSSIPGQTEVDGAGGQGDLFASAPESTDGIYTLIETEEALADLASKLAAAGTFAFDTETTQLNPVAARLAGLSFSFKSGSGFYVPVRGDGPTLSEDAVRKWLGPVLADAGIRKCGQNLKYDLVVLANAQIPVAGVSFDTMIASFVLDSTRRSHGMDALAMELLHYQPIPISSLIGKGKDRISFDRVPTDRACQYAAEDADVTWRLYEVLQRQMTDPELSELFATVEMPLLEVLAEMELRGVAVDTAVLARMSGEMAGRLTELRDRIHTEAGRPFNVDSTKQLAEVLFDERGLRVVRKTKTGRSTDAEVLTTLSAESDDPIPRWVLEYRELAKLKGTYVDALPELVDQRTGRIHPSFHQTGAVTGRLSCSDPNLQNIPIRTETGAQIRRAFVPGEADWVLLKADYSQIELRVLAHFSGDKALAAAFNEDRDIHAFVASQIEGVPLDQVTNQQRSRAKTVNFGIVYGQSAFGLSRQTGMSMNDARVFIERYFARYPLIRGFLDKCISHARRHGYVKTILGRRRTIREINSRNRTARSAAERFAVNTVVQGSAADMIKRAMINIAARIRKERRPSRMLIQVHDELVFEVPENAVAEESSMIIEEMSRAIPLDVPVKVDAAWGPNWLDMKKQ